MTAKWETYLRKIGNGDGAANHFLSNIEKFLDSLIQNVPGQIETTTFQVQSIPSTARSTKRNVEVAPCPTCGKGMIVTRKDFYGCTAYKEGCKQTFPGIFLKKKITPTQVKLLCTKGQTNVINGFVAKNGNKFNAYFKVRRTKNQLRFRIKSCRQNFHTRRQLFLIYHLQILISLPSLNLISNSNFLIIIC